jgi:hypothetical protein
VFSGVLERLARIRGARFTKNYALACFDPAGNPQEKIRPSP